MRRVTNSPAPSHWTSGFPAPAAFGLLVIVGGAVYSATQMVVAIQRSSPLAAIATAGLTVFFSAMVCALACTLLVTSDRDTRWDDGGTTLRVNPSIAWCYGVALLGGLVGSACYLVLSWWGDSGRLPLAAAGNGGVARFLMAALLVLSAGGLIALLRTREPGRLRIDVDGNTHFDILRTRTASWSEVESVTDEAGRRVRNPVVFTVRNGKPIVVSNADRYGSGGAAAYWLARHYWRHPADRGELVDGRALERLREGGFGPV